MGRRKSVTIPPNQDEKFDLVNTSKIPSVSILEKSTSESISDEKYSQITEALKFGSASTTTPWIQRKEISAWTALAFYLLIISKLYSFFLESNNTLNTWELIFLLVLNILLLIPFFTFLHSQYAVIYHNHSYSMVLRKILFNLIKNGNSDKFNVSHYVHSSQNSEEIEKEIADELKHVRPIKGRWYPFSIIKRTLIYYIKRGKATRPSNFQIQEASLYMIMVIPPLGILIILIRNLLV